jgi:hypothetical protein
MMEKKWFLFLLLVFLLSVSVPLRAQDEKTFPTDTEIQLLLTQADRAIQQYKPLIDQEEIQFGKSGAEAVAKDRQVVQGIEMAVQTLQKKPQGFNSPAGFAFFEWLDDASRNAMVCSTSLMTQATVSLMAGEISKATELIHLGQSCMDVSSLIYTVSENAGALYERYVNAEEQLAQKDFDTSQKCFEALKKLDAANKQKKQ